MALPYIILAISLASFGIGFGTSYKIEHGEVLKLELAIERENSQAHEIMDSAKERVISAQNEAFQANINLDKSHESAIQTINYYHDKLANVGLLDPYRKSCPNTMPKGAGSSKLKGNAENGTKLSDKLTEFLKSEARRADQVAVERNTLLDFVHNNCGIK